MKTREFDPGAAASAVLETSTLLLESTQRRDLREHAPQNGHENSTEFTESAIREYLATVTPTPLGSPTGLPAFPVQALPTVLADMVAAVAESKQVDPGSPGVMALGVVSAATCGRVQVLPRAGWTEEVNLFVLVSADPSERKGPVERELRRPLDEATAELQRRWAPGAREAEVTRSIAAKAAAAAAEKAAKLQDVEARQTALAEALDLDVAAEAIEIPPMPKLVAGGDITPEALAEVMHRHGGRITVLDTEGGFFDRIAGLYSNGVKNLDAVLHGYAGEPVEVNRRSGSEHIPRAGLSLVLMVQPVVLAKLITDPEMTGRGLLARFLFAGPPSLVGRRRTGRNVPGIPGDVANAYRGRVRDLAIELDGWTDPAQLAFTSGALDVLDVFEADVERRQLPGGDLAVTGPWAGKFTGNVLRVAAILHLAEHGPDGLRRPIEQHTITSAIDLGGYFIAHAKAVLAPRRGAVDDARVVLAYLHRHQLTEFSIRQMHTGLPRKQFATVDVVQDAVDVLANHGWVAELPMLKRGGPGRRPSPRYVVNPALGRES